jgi:hypothetical protein
MAGDASWLPSRAFAYIQSFFQPRPGLHPNLPRPPPKLAARHPTQHSILRHLPEQAYFEQTAPEGVGDIPLPSFDPGVFDNEMHRLKLYPTLDPEDPSLVREPEGNITQGSYIGTQIALTQAYSRIEQT